MTTRSDVREVAVSGGTTRLALRPRDAAIALSMSPRKLWELTQRGEIPHVREGRMVLYPVAALEAWLMTPQQSTRRGGSDE